MGCVEEGKESCGVCEEVWESVWGEFGEVCRVDGGRSMGEGKKRCGGVKKCVRVYGVSVESVGKCVGVWGKSGKRYGGVGESKEICGGHEEVWGNV